MDQTKKGMRGTRCSCCCCRFGGSDESAVTGARFYYYKKQGWGSLSVARRPDDESPSGDFGLPGGLPRADTLHTRTVDQYSYQVRYSTRYCTGTRTIRVHYVHLLYVHIPYTCTHSSCTVSREAFATILVVVFKGCHC